MTVAFAMIGLVAVVAGGVPVEEPPSLRGFLAACEAGARPESTTAPVPRDAGARRDDGRIARSLGGASDAIHIRKWYGRSGNNLNQLAAAYGIALASGRRYVSTPRDAPKGLDASVRAGHFTGARQLQRSPPMSVGSQSFRRTFRRAIVSRSGLERARAEHPC